MNPLDVDDKPPYVEVYSHHPLMYLSLADYQQQACQQVPPRELLYWCHGVQCKIDDVAGRLGLYKIKVMGQQGPSCMFTISPDMPPKQQSDVLLTAAQLLRATLAKVLLPGGGSLASQLTIHAGKYAGGVIGRGSWTYDLFGSDVQDLMDMDKFNTPNCIQVSDAALALMSDITQFRPHNKVVCSGREVTLHQWVGQTEVGSPREAGASVGARAAQAFKAAADLARRAEAAEQGRTSTGSFPLHQQLRSDLGFKDSQVEAAYLDSQSRQLARMDMLFVAVTVLMIGCLACSSSSVSQLVLASCGHWLMPVVAAAWHIANPQPYARWREPVWVLHRVLSALNVGAMLACSMLLQQGGVSGLGSKVAAVCGLAPGAEGVHRGVSGLMKRGAVITLAESLGFRVRLRVQLFTSVLNAAVTVLYVYWQWTSSSSSTSLPVADLALRLTVSCVAPAVLLYLWELEERSWFLSGQRPGGKKSAAAGASGLSGKGGVEESVGYGLKHKTV